MTTTTLVHAGDQLRQRREELRLSQWDIIEKSGGQLTNQQVSRIEKGRIEKPPMPDLVVYGTVLGMSPNQMAELYGWWRPVHAQEEPEAPIVSAVRRLARSLPTRLRQEFLANLEFAVSLAIAKRAPRTSRTRDDVNQLLEKLEAAAPQV